MPRRARKRSNTGIYHVVMRGINKQNIFEDREDYVMFIRSMNMAQEDGQYKIHAYCLMSNHIHILFEEGKEPIGESIKRICCRFVRWYNDKYERVGRLFQDRFMSIPVETPAKYLRTIHYIFQNPVKANLSTSVETYPWTNISAYLGYPDPLTETETALSFYNSRKEFLKKMNEPVEGSEEFEPNNGKARMVDQRAWKIIESICGCRNINEFQKVDKNVRDKVLYQLKEQRFSVRDISRLTGVSKSVVARA